ncbi:DEAD/DEAH box helicase [bacterium]|nr:DEAD/DEAH box helicase [bacterium]
MNEKINELKSSLITGFIDKSTTSLERLRPEILLNDTSTNIKVLTTILNQLNVCDEFCFSVAFLRMSGFKCLVNTLQELEEKGINGKILVSKYLNFTQPDALRHLLKFSNIELRIGDFHSKGYLFKKGEIYELIIGSSNLTSDALCSNTEMNLKVSATKDSELITNAINQFETEFNKGIIVDDLFINKYEELFNAQSSHDYLINQKNIKLKPKNVKPNQMQIRALKNLDLLRLEGKTRALIISATGTGKTFLCAFDVKKFKAKKFLFVVHRANIANAAMSTFKAVFGNSVSMGVYSGSKRDIDSEYIFSTVQTISRSNHLERFSRNHFDYIVIDETHRAGAQSYDKIINYFEPKFLLGMTATPERTDGADIFKLFNHNIAYEIRLHNALNENMLCPFHYFGVTDITVNGELLNEHSDFNILTSNTRIDHIIDKLSLYGCDDGIPKGLIFCSRNSESKELSIGFNKRGYKTISLSGSNTEKERKDAIKSLEAGNLNYIFTVDIFNEGIDIPCLNQIIMLRPTQSAIIFVQQLGRGLRKLDKKDYLTVIDFIGNYKNNYLIAIALHGDTSYNKDSIRKCIKEGIVGPSTINFDRISKEKIFSSINSANMQTKRELVNDYQLLKYKIGKIPSMVDFINHGSRDPFLYVDKYKSYYNFLCYIIKDIKENLNLNEKKILELFSLEINNSKRVEESILLKKLISFNSISIKDFQTEIFDKYNYHISIETLKSIINNLNFNFIRGNNTFDIALIDSKNICSGKVLIETLKNKIFKKYLLDSIESCIKAYNKKFVFKEFLNGFLIDNKYSMKDIFRILNWKKNPVALNVGGYPSPKDNKFPIFVKYKKDKYDDKFINNDTFEWQSKNNRSLNSPEIKEIKFNKNIKIPLFINKAMKNEGTEYYFISFLKPIVSTVKEVTNKYNNRVVQVNFKLETPISDKLLNYLTS